MPKTFEPVEKLCTGTAEAEIEPSPALQNTALMLEIASVETTKLPNHRDWGVFQQARGFLVLPHSARASVVSETAVRLLNVLKKRL